MGFDMSAVQRDLLRRFWRFSHGFVYRLPNSPPAPAVEPVVDRLVRAVFRRTVHPPASGLQHMHDPAQDAPIIVARRSGLLGWQKRLNLRPLLIIEPEQVRTHELAPDSVDQLVESQQG